MKYKPYTVFSPPWETTSGGVRVMYGLYAWLITKGQIVFMNAQFNNNDCVAIYPEIQRGNPAQAKTVVRYILNKPGLIPALMSDGSIVNGPTEFDDGDILYYFSKMFGDGEVMFLPIIDTHLFRDRKKKRTKTAYFVGKGVKDPNIQSKFVHPDDAILIDRNLAQDQGLLADVLNECQVLYDYDPVSAMTEIARLCGCPVIYLSDVYSEKDYEKYEPGTQGMVWGGNEIPKLDSEAFASHYKSLKDTFSSKLDEFIERTQK